MWKKLWVRVLFVIFIIWMIISAYFYSQHLITIRQYTIDKEIALQDIKVEIKEVTIENFKRKPVSFNFAQEHPLILKVANSLPYPLLGPFSSVCSFYSTPYVFDNEFQTINLNGRFVSDQFIGELDNYDIIRNIDMELIDEEGQYYSHGLRTDHDETKNFILFAVHDENFPIERIDNVMTIVVEDEKNEITHQFKIKPEFVTKRYNFFCKKPRWDDVDK